MGPNAGWMASWSGADEPWRLAHPAISLPTLGWISCAFEFIVISDLTFDVRLFCYRFFYFACIEVFLFCL